ncbi:hypothetical protein [Sinomicrobium sp. M5D2P9]
MKFESHNKKMHKETQSFTEEVVAGYKKVAGFRVPEHSQKPG